MKMSSTYLSSPAPNKTNIFIADYERTDSSDVESRIKLALFGLCITIAAVTFFGSVFSLLSLLRMRRKTSLCLIVASMSVDDLLSMVPLSLFILQQWDGYGNADSRTLCNLSGLLYVFQGVASNMKAWLIAAYTFYVTKRFGVLRSVRRPFRVMWSIAGVWLVSLAVSVLPLCGWGTFAQSSLGCFPESEGFYVVLLFTLYSLCFCGLLFFFFPLTYQLLCSGEPQTKLFFPRYFEIARAPSKDGSAPLCDLSSLSRDSLNKSFGAFNELSPGSLGKGPGLKDKVDTYTCSTPASGSRPTDVTIDSPAIFAQKRFSMILAVVRIVLWMPMMSLMLVRHIANIRSSALEIISFFMTLLAPTVTPLFALSKRWIHLPCGCFINCQRYPEQDPAAMKRRLEFNLSFQQGYSIYKLSHASKSQHSPAIEKPSYHDLFNCPFPDNQLQIIDGAAASNLRSDLDSRSSHADLLLEAVAGGGEALADRITFPHGDDDERFCCTPSPSPQSIHQRDCEVHNLTDTSSVFEGPERRLSHVECRKIELTDWEWCRSKSERTPRQRSTGGLAIPLCAFQGTVSLQAPTGKTLSLSTYEVSSDGLKISPHNAKKVEVYRSKSVGHEPSADEAASAGQNADVSTGGMGVGMGMELELGLGGGVGDTNVKIHLEVLEICDNEEAMDSVSIISNISQSSTHARSPSLRYSRRENRFVSCDLGETASYSLLIPTSGNPETDSINISIPDTVEAHRQNSRRQTQENSGYKEEIQLLNEAYRKQTGDREE